MLKFSQTPLMKTFELLQELQDACDCNMGIMSIVYSEACGYYITVEFLGEPDKTIVTKDASQLEWAAEAAVLQLNSHNKLKEPS